MRGYRIKSLVLVALFTIAVVMIYLALYEMADTYYDIWTIKSIFSNTKNLYNISVWAPGFGDAFIQGEYEFYSQLESVEGVETSGRFYSDNKQFVELSNNLEFIKYNQSIVDGINMSDYPDAIRCYYLDRGFDKLMNKSQLIQEKKGNWNPVLIGSDYKDFFEEGDIVTDVDNNKYRICGILPEGYCIPPKGIFNSPVPYTELDGAFLVLYDKNMDDTIHSNIFGSEIYCVTDGTIETEERIEQLADKYFVHIQLSTIDECIQNKKDEDKVSMQTTLLFTGIMVLAASIAMIAESVIQIILKKREYGILYANGVSRWDSVKLIAMENLLRQGAAVGIATAIAWTKISGYTKMGYMNMTDIFLRMVIWRACVIMIILFVLSTAIPVIVLSGLKMVELLGGNEL